MPESTRERKKRKRRESWTDDFLLLCLVGKRVGTKGATATFEAVKMLFHPLDVLETEFCLDDLHVACGVDLALDVDDFCVIEGAYDLEDAVYSAYMGEEGVTETSTGGGTLGGCYDVSEEGQK